MPLRLIVIVIVIQIDSFPGTVQEVARLSPVHTKKEIKNFTFVAEYRGSSGHIHVKMAKCGKMRQF